MATHLSFWPIFIFTFLMVSSLLSSAQEVSLVKEPDLNYYIVKKVPVVIVCQAKNAAEISFTCLGTQIPSTSVEVKDVSDIDPDLTEAEIEVTRADLQNTEGHGAFWCQCSAVDNEGNVVVTSRKGIVSIASLKTKFETEPISTTVTVGEDVEFACAAPEGEPKPEIVWRQDKKRLDVENNPRIYVTQKDSLVIQFVVLADKGLYQCVARNVAGRRESQEAQLTVTALAESAEPDLLEQEVPNKKSAGGKLRTTRQSTIKTYYTTEPKDQYFLTDDKPVTLDCGVVAADILTFNCNGKRMDRERQTINQGLDNAGNRVIQSQLSITIDDWNAFLKESTPEKKFQCVCVAWFQQSGEPSGWGRIDSNLANGFIYLAHLDKEFQTEPSDVTAALNTDAVMICEPPKGQPSPWVYWYKDRSRLDPRTTEKYSMNAKGHLTVHHVEYDDAGTYYCLAENSVSSAQSRPGRLIVIAEVLTTPATQDSFPTFPAVIPTSPVFITDFESEYTLEEDGTKKLVCAVMSADQMTIDCGGQRLPADEYTLRSEIHRETGKRLLHVTAVITAEKIQQNPEDYFCQCTAWFVNSENAWERISSSQGFIRLAPAGQAYIENEFVTPPEDTDATLESEAEFYCQPPAGNPAPEVYWLKDGVRIDSDADPNFVMMESGSLFIELVRVSDEGVYTCVAENEAGIRRSQPVRFTVLEKPITDVRATPRQPDSRYEATTPDYDTSTYDDGTPFFLHDLKHEYYVVENNPVMLSCSVVNAKILLFVCNGEVLRDTATTGYQTELAHTRQILRENILTVTREKIERYRGHEPYTCLCRVYYNKEGTAPAAYSTIDSSSTSIYIAHMEEHFRAEPSDTEVTNYERVELKCTAPDGVPDPKVSWLKDNYSVVESEKIRIDQNGNLIIERFNVNDEGTYNCVANNSFTELISRSARVTLRGSSKPGKETAEPEPGTTPSDTEKLYSGKPYISKDLHSVYYLVKNKPVTITCEAYNVELITFTCGMQTVANPETKDRMEEVSLHDGQTTMVKVIESSINVSKDEVEDYGHGKEYWCKCFAHYRDPRTHDREFLESVKGVVEIAYLKKIFQKEPESKTIVEGDSLTLTCQPPLGNPLPKVTWTRNGENIEELSITPTGVLIIPVVQLEHAGEYICVAENEAGKRMTLPVNVEIRAMDGSLPSKPDTEENVDGETEEGSQTKVDESEIDSDANREAEEVAESCLNGETDQCLDKGKSEENIDEDDKNNLDIEITEWQVSEGGQDPHWREKDIDDIFEEKIHETVEENKEEDLGGRTIEGQNENEEYGGRDRNSDKYEGHEEEVYEGRFETKDNDKDEDNEDKDHSYKERDETIDRKEEDGNIIGFGSQKSFEGNECAQMLSSCSNILPRNVNHLVLCAAVPDYTACVDNYFKQCSGIVNEISMNAVRMAYTDTQQKCIFRQKCSKLKECKVISSNSLDKAMDMSGLSVHDLCINPNEVLQCVDHKLEDCNVTMSPPEEDVKASLFDIGDWFTQYCNNFILRDEKEKSCDIDLCELQIEQVASDNATYWCNIMQTLDTCTEEAAAMCKHDDLTDELSHFRSHVTEKYCPGDMIKGPWPEVTAEPEGKTDSGEAEPEPKGNKDVTEPTNGGDNGEGGSEENKETGAEGKPNGGDFGSEEDFENNNEDADRENEDVVVTSKTKDKYNTNSDNSEEEDSSSEDDFNEIDERSRARKKEEDHHFGRERPHVNDEKSEEKDNNMSVDDIRPTPKEYDDSINQVEDGDQGEVEAAVVEASKKDPGNGAAQSGTCFLLATILQLVTVVCLSWR